LIRLAKENDTHGHSSNNLLQLLVRSNEDKGTQKDYRLSPDELLGDVHIFTIAGFETTLRYALLRLALDPSKQQSLRQGIKEALHGQPDDPRDWAFAEVFPKLVSPLCVMVSIHTNLWSRRDSPIC
jgi:cytochrome P450